MAFVPWQHCWGRVKAQVESIKLDCVVAAEVQLSDFSMCLLGTHALFLLESLSVTCQGSSSFPPVPAILLLCYWFVYHFKQIQSRLYLEISIQAATVFFKEAIMFASSWQILGLVLLVFVFLGFFCCCCFFHFEVILFLVTWLLASFFVDMITNDFNGQILS